jgi:hypothetical protein
MTLDIDFKAKSLVHDVQEIFVVELSPKHRIAVHWFTDVKDFPIKNNLDFNSLPGVSGLSFTKAFSAAD